MALTDFQRGICRLVAEQRKEAGVSYVAGGVALNLLLKSGRVSRDIDVFHDAEAAVHASFTADRRLLELHGYRIETVRERRSSVRLRRTPSASMKDRLAAHTRVC